MRVSIHTDGASKGNPGPAGCGAVLRFPGSTIRLAKGLGRQTNNVAEYEGVILGVEAAIAGGATHVRVYSDSELVVKQINGEYTARNDEMRALRDRVWKLREQIPFCVFSHVFREDNENADKQANKGVKLSTGEVLTS